MDVELCIQCHSKPIELDCPCDNAGYCSNVCAKLFWKSGHNLTCTANPVLGNTVTEPLALLDNGPVASIGASPAENQLYALMKTDDFHAVTPNDIKNSFRKAYPPSNFPYLVQHYDRCGSQKLLLLDPTGKWAMGSFTSMQRLAREFLGPWSKKRGHIISAPTGAGKTIIGQAVAGNYRYEKVSLPNPVAGETERIEVHRTILYVTRTTLVRDVKKALWGQTSSNLASIRKRTEAADLPVFDLENPAPFNTEINVISFKTFTNMLSGSNPQGRRLWAGLPINNREDPKLKGYRAAPNAYRLEGSEWVRGNAPHSLALGTFETVYDLKLVWTPATRRKLKAGGDSLLKSFVNKITKEWDKKARRSANLAEISRTTFELLDRTSPEIHITFQFKKVGTRRLPDSEEWANWAGDVDSVLADETTAKRSAAYNFHQENLAKLKRLEPGIQTELGPTGYALVRKPVGKTTRLVWTPTEDTEVDFNPFNAVTVILDEADMAFDPKKVRAGERANAKLLDTVKRDSESMVIIAMSATIDLYALLGLARLIIPKQKMVGKKALVPTLPMPKNEEIPVIFDVHNLTWSETVDRLGDLFNRKTGELDRERWFNIETALRGSVSAMTVDKMLDLFPRFDPKESRRRDFVLGELHTNRILEAFQSRPKLSASRLAHTVAFAQDRLAQELRIGSSVFDVDAVAERLVFGPVNREGVDALFPAAYQLLKALRADDWEEELHYQSRGLPHLKPGKRVIISSLESDDFGVVPSTSSMQAAGYQWLPVIRQETKLKILQREVFKQPLNQAKQQELKELKLKLAQKRKLGILPDKHKTVRVLIDQPFEMFNAELKAKLGPTDPSRNKVLVLSTSLSWDRDPQLKEPHTLQDLLDASLDSELFDTKFVFASSKQLHEELMLVPVEGESKEENLARIDAKKQIIRTIKDHKVYFWPGVNNPQFDSSVYSKDDVDFLSKRFKDGIGLFIRKVPGIDDEETFGRELRYLEPYPLDLTDFGVDFNALQPGDDITPLKRIANFNTKLSREEMLDAADIVQRVWNSDENIFGDIARYVLVSGVFNQGIDLNGATRAYNTESAKGRTSELQRRGRYIRRCSAVGLHYPEQWHIISSTFVPLLSESLAGFLTYEKVMSTADPEEEMEVDEPRRHRRERGVVTAIEIDPLEHGDPNPYGDEREILLPYQAIRLRTEDPSVAALRLEGFRLLQEWAIDARHNEIGLDSVEHPRYAFTNYRLIRSQIQQLVDSLPEPEPLPTMQDFQVNKENAVERVRTRALEAGLIQETDEFTEFQAIFFLGQLSGQKADPLRDYFDDLLENFKGDEALLVLRRLAQAEDERTLFVSRTGSRVPLTRATDNSNVMLEPGMFKVARNDPGWDGKQNEFLLYLVQNRFAVAAPIFRALRETPTREKPKRPKEGPDEPGTPKRKKESDDDDNSDEFLSSIMFATSICNDLIGNEDEAGITVGTELESPATPDQDQELIETSAVKLVQQVLERMNLWGELGDVSPEKCASRIVKRATGPKKPSKAEKVTTLKKVLVDLYAQGFMNWNSSIKILYRVLLAADNFALKDIRRYGSVIAALFRLAFYDAVSFVDSFNTFFEIPTDLYRGFGNPIVLTRFLDVLLMWTLPFDTSKKTFGLPLVNPGTLPETDNILMHFLQRIQSRLYLNVPEMLFRFTKPLTELILKEVNQITGELGVRETTPDLFQLAQDIERLAPLLKTKDAPESYSLYLQIVLSTSNWDQAREQTDPSALRNTEIAGLLEIPAVDTANKTTDMLLNFVKRNQNNLSDFPYFARLYEVARRIATDKDSIVQVVAEIVPALPETQRTDEKWRKKLLQDVENKIGLVSHQETGFKTKKAITKRRFNIVVSTEPFGAFDALQPYYIDKDKMLQKITDSKHKVVKDLYDIYKRMGYEYSNKYAKTLPTSFVERLVSDVAQWMRIKSGDVRKLMKTITGDGPFLEKAQTWASFVARLKKYKKLKKTTKRLTADAPDDSAREKAFRALITKDFELKRWEVISQVLAFLALGTVSRYIHLPSPWKKDKTLFELGVSPKKLDKTIATLFELITGNTLVHKTDAERIFTDYVNAVFEIYGGQLRTATRRSKMFKDLAAHIRNHIDVVARAPPLPEFDPDLEPPDVEVILRVFRNQNSDFLQHSGYDIEADYNTRQFRWVVVTPPQVILEFFNKRVTSLQDALKRLAAAPPLLPEKKPEDVPQGVVVIDKCALCGEVGPGYDCDCKTASYCNSVCQAIDWPAHKQHCTRAVRTGNVGVPQPVNDETRITNLIEKAYKLVSCDRCESPIISEVQCECGEVRYCCDECMTRDWLQHSDVCSAIRVNAGADYKRK